MNPFSGLPPFSYDELQKNIGGLVYPNGITPDGMSQEQMFRQGVGQLGAGMLAASNKNPMQALGMSYLEAQNQGLNNARQVELAESMRSKRKEREDREKRRTALGNYLREYPNLPENIRKMADADPEGVFNWMQDRYQTVGGRGVIDTMTGQPTQFAGMDDTKWSTSGQNFAVRENADGTVEVAPVQYADKGGSQILDPNTGQPIPDAEKSGWRIMDPESVSEARARGKENLEAPKARARVQQFNQQGKAIRTQVDMLLRDPEALQAATGVLDQRLPSYQQAMENARAIIGGLENMLSARALQQMRDSSPTGGAVGQVTEAEWGRLAATLANLKQSQGTPQFMEQLKLLWQQLEESEMIAVQQYQNTHGEYAKKRGELALPVYEQPPMPESLSSFSSPQSGGDLQLPPGVIIKSKDGQPYQPPAPQQQAPQRPVAPWGIP